MTTFDEPILLAAMRSYLAAADALDAAADVGGARQLLDLAEAKAIAGMALRKRLLEQGWVPAGHSVTR